MRAVNLIPVDQRAGQPVGAGRSQGAAYAVLVLVGGFALMAFLYGQSKHQVSSRRAQAAALAAQAQRAQAAAERLAPYTSFITQREQRVQAVNALVDSRFDWAHILHEFGRVLPPQTSITSLNGSAGGAQHNRRRGCLGSRPDVHARRVRDKPAGGGADARAPATDRRRQGSHARGLLLRHRRSLLGLIVRLG